MVLKRFVRGRRILFMLLCYGLSRGISAHAEDAAKYYEPNRCGPIALFVVCRLYDVEATLDELSDLAGTHRDGTSIAGLVAAAKAKGIKAKAWHSSVGHLKRLGGPAIIDFPAGHFCVFLGWKDGEAM